VVLINVCLVDRYLRITTYSLWFLYFINYFINVTHSIQVENLDNTPSPRDNLNLVYTKSFPQIHLTPVTANEIKNIIKSLKMKNSYGYDEIPPKFLKLSLPYHLYIYGTRQCPLEYSLRGSNFHKSPRYSKRVIKTN
jgi:hypothetical protein